jgi:hypothetical protein
MQPFERLVVAYLVILAAAAPFARVPRAQRMRTIAIAVSSAVAVQGASAFLPPDVRLWLAFLYIPLGYWVPVPLVPASRGGRFESWLRRSEDRLRNTRLRAPRWLVHAMEWAYFFCFPMVPAAFAVVWTTGSVDDVARFWTAVLGAGFACYVTLPWLVSRPPRTMEGSPRPVERTAIARANHFVLGRVSHQLVTFPSGHVAVSIASALAAGAVWPAAGALFAIIAAGVAGGAIAGRYHFIVDVALGFAVGVMAAGLA